MAERPGSPIGCTRRDLLIGSACLVGAGVAAAAPRREETRIRTEDIERLVPERLGQWQSIGRGGVIVSEESPLTRETYDAVLTRVYLAGAMPPIMLLIAYAGSQIGDTQIHRPESCYPAAGFKLDRPLPVRIELLGRRDISTRLIKAVSPQRTEHVLYWTRIGSEFPNGRVAQHLTVLRETLRGRVPDGILIRISVLNTSSEAVLPVLRGFIAALLTESSPAARRLMIGDASLGGDDLQIRVNIT